MLAFQQSSAKGGIERVVNIQMNKDEQAMFDASVAAVKGLVAACKRNRPFTWLS